jgi:hypothetical protein
MKYLGINLMKETKHLFNENYNGRGHQKMERSSMLMVSRINIVKIDILPEAIYMLNAFLSKF